LSTQPEAESAQEDQEDGDPTSPSICLGDAVRLRLRPRYLKTADPMPMLRPPDLVDLDEVGLVVEVRVLGLLAVRFRRGTFLVTATELTSLAPPESHPG